MGPAPSTAKGRQDFAEADPIKVPPVIRREVWFVGLPIGVLREIVADFPHYIPPTGYREAPSVMTLVDGFRNGEVTGMFSPSLRADLKPGIRIVGANLTFANTEDADLFFTVFPPTEVDMEPVPLDDVMFAAWWGDCD